MTLRPAVRPSASLRKACGAQRLVAATEVVDAYDLVARERVHLVEDVVPSSTLEADEHTLSRADGLCQLGCGSARLCEALRDDRTGLVTAVSVGRAFPPQAPALEALPVDVGVKQADYSVDIALAIPGVRGTDRFDVRVGHPDSVTAVCVA